MKNKNLEIVYQGRILQLKMCVCAGVCDICEISQMFFSALPGNVHKAKPWALHST